jgi:hypothetical protein
MALREDSSMSQLAKVELILKVQKHLLETVFLLLSGGIKSEFFLVIEGGPCFPHTIEEPWRAKLNPLIWASPSTTSFFRALGLA